MLFNVNSAETLSNLNTVTIMSYARVALVPSMGVQTICDEDAKKKIAILNCRKQKRQNKQRKTPSATWPMASSFSHAQSYQKEIQFVYPRINIRFISDKKQEKSPKKYACIFQDTKKFQKNRSSRFLRDSQLLNLKTFLATRKRTQFIKQPFQVKNWFKTTITSCFLQQQHTFNHLIR